MTTASPVLRFLERYRHTQLLVSVSLLLVIHPFVESRLSEVAVDVLLAVTFLSAVFAFANRRVSVVIGLGLTVVVQGLGWYRGFQGFESVSVLHSVLSLLFFGYFTALVLGDVFRARGVSTDTIAGALAAYLLIGIWWAFAYALLEHVLPGSIVGLREQGQSGYQQYMGYSFITLTTLGYGNVVPGNSKADMIAAAEAIVGQLYLTVLVARLVAMSITGRQVADAVDSDD